MAGPAQGASGSRALVGWAAAAGLVVFGFALVPLLGLSWVLPGSAQGNWSLVMLAVVVALLLGLTTTRLAIGIGQASGLATADEAKQVIALWKRPWVPWALIALALLMFVAVAFALLGIDNGPGFRPN